jgi:putative cell wall-binding protein
MDEDTFHNSMYGHSEDDLEPVVDTTQSISDQLTATMTATTATLTVNGKSVIVPTMAYVKALENMVEEQARALRALKTQVSQQRHAINTHTQDINGLGRDLDRKADYFG